MVDKYEGTAINLRGQCVGLINTDTQEEVDEFILENESVLVSVTVTKNGNKFYSSNTQDLTTVINKIYKDKSLSEKEIELINDTNVCAVYGFTSSIGHLTLEGKNALIRANRKEILLELSAHYKNN